MSSPEQLTNRAGVVVFDGTAAPGGGSQPGALRVLPVVIDLAALSLGEQTLYTPAAGEWVIVTFSLDGFLASDVDWDLYIGQNLAASPGNYFVRKNDISAAATTMVDQVSGLPSASRHRAGTAVSVLDGIVEDTAPIVAALKPDFDISGVFCAAGGSWLPNHAYAAFDNVQGSDGALYQADADGGTSGLVQPTWPGNGGTVVDNDITWTWTEDPPSAGAYTVVLLIGGAVS